MDSVLLTIGLLLIACTLTLMWSGRKSWLVAIAQGIGLQALAGAMVAAVQVAMFMPADVAPTNALDRAQMGVQGMAFNAAGWTTRAIYDRTSSDDDAGPQDHIEAYLPVAAGQIVLIALLIGARRVKGGEEGHIDPLQILIVILVLANAGANITWPWWQG